MPSDLQAVPDDIGGSCAVPEVGSDNFERAARPGRRLHGLSQERRDANRFRATLIEHVGKPTIVQLAMIDTLAQLKLKLIVLDNRFIEEVSMSPLARREYLAFVNSFSRLLRQLGIGSAPMRRSSTRTPRMIMGLDPTP